jgi:putative ATPase
VRRLIRFAAEDIGMADPQALIQAIAAQQAYEFLGSPEGDLCITQAVIYLATAPKSNAVYMAHKDAQAFAHKHGALMPPKHILNAPTNLLRQEGYGKGYQYDHDRDDAFSGQNYFPDKLVRPTLYRPHARGFEREIQKRLIYWQTKRQKP